jgi:hypothetical protein
MVTSKTCLVFQFHNKIAFWMTKFVLRPSSLVTAMTERGNGAHVDFHRINAPNSRSAAQSVAGDLRIRQRRRKDVDHNHEHLLPTVRDSRNNESGP